MGIEMAPDREQHVGGVRTEGITEGEYH